MKVNQYAFRIEENLMLELKKLGIKEDRSTNYMVKKAIAFFVESENKKRK